MVRNCCQFTGCTGFVRGQLIGIEFVARQFMRSSCWHR